MDMFLFMILHMIPLMYRSRCCRHGALPDTPTTGLPVLPHLLVPLQVLQARLQQRHVALSARRARAGDSHAQRLICQWRSLGAHAGQLAERAYGAPVGLRANIGGAGLEQGQQL